jgi:nucleoside-diphosphate-sugar epimerase
MRVLIVGCGYVGIPLGAMLVEQGHQVWGMRRSGAAEQELGAYGIQPLVADITVPGSLTALPSVYDWVVHCVSASGGGAAEYRRVYLEGARHLLTWLSAAPPQRFVYTSSTSVYGQTDGSLVDETSPTLPGTDSARVLVETEQLLLTAFRDRALAVNVLRLAGIYGPGRGYWLKQFLKGEARIEGDGSRFLNMIHRDDVAGAVIAVLRKGHAGEIYNLVDAEPVSQITCFQWLAQRLGRELPPRVSEDEETLRKRGMTNKRVSNRKMREALGYSLRYPTFREGYSAELARLGIAGPRR